MMYHDTTSDGVPAMPSANYTQYVRQHKPMRHRPNLQPISRPTLRIRHALVTKIVVHSSQQSMRDAPNV